MRIMIMFDLPVDTANQRREYRRFRKYLIEMGFIMMQESIYTKLTLNMTATQSIMADVRKNRPREGLVQALIITEKQFAKMEIILGSVKYDVIDTTERLVIL